MPRIRKLDGLEGNVLKLAAVRFLCFMHLMSAVIPAVRGAGRPDGGLSLGAIIPS